MIDPITAGLNFGSIRTGITLSASQRHRNQAAGLDVSTIIEQQGYYLQILTRAPKCGNRGTPVINFWYTDGGRGPKDHRRFH